MRNDYHIVPVYLSVSEQEIYDDLSEIGAIVAAAKDGILTPSQKQSLNIATGTRSRLLGSVEDKSVLYTNSSIKFHFRTKTDPCICGEESL